MQLGIMSSLKRALSLSVTLAVGAGVGSSLFHSDVNYIATWVLGAAFWGFIFGLFINWNDSDEK
jgi:hypothetical protein